MKKLLYLFIVSSLLATTASCGQAKQEQTDKDTVTQEEIIEDFATGGPGQFLERITQFYYYGEIERLAPYYIGGHRTHEYLTVPDTIAKYNKKFSEARMKHEGFKAFCIRSTEQNGDILTVKADVVFGDTTLACTPIDIVKINGRWYVLSPD